MSIPIDFFTKLPPWSADPLRQSEWIDDLKVLLTELDTAITDAVVDVVTLEQAASPVQGDWETAYTTQTSKSLPIPESAQLYWWDSTNQRFGGSFGTVRSGDNTVYRRTSIYAPGSTYIVDSNFATSDITVDYAIGTNLSDHPALTVELVVKTKLYMSYQLLPTLDSGSGTWGADFLLNGAKVGSQYYNLPTDRALMEQKSDQSYINVFAETPTLNPGTYVVQSMFGRTGGTTPILSIGGNNGIRLMIVRGIVSNE